MFSLYCNFTQYEQAFNLNLQYDNLSLNMKMRHQQLEASPTVKNTTTREVKTKTKKWERAARPYVKERKE